MPKKNSRRTIESTGADKASRRGFLKGGAGLVAGAAVAQLLPRQIAAQQNAGNAGLLERLTNPGGRPIILKNGYVLSLDSQVGDFERGDVLIQGKKILSVGPNLAAPAQSIVVDAAGMIIMPGFVDTHHHQYETVLRAINADGRLGTLPFYPEAKSYRTVIQAIFTPIYLPEDARVAELIASLNQINVGVTTTVDTSQVQLTPAHTDACIAGLKESGRRALFTYTVGGPDAATKFPQELQRLRKQYFSSDDQLLTLGSGGGSQEQWKIARSIGAPIVNHVVGQSANLNALAQAGLMGPDNEYIHCTRLSDGMWKMIADTGGKVSIATAIEMKSGQGTPPIQAALDHGIQPSLSVDNETSMPADFFTQMRATFTVQRMFINERTLNGEQNVPSLMKSRDAIEMATIAGAKAAHLDYSDHLP